MGAVVALALVAVLAGFYVAGRAGARVGGCEQHRTDSAQRAASTAGDRTDVVVIGDSWSVGLGLEDAGTSWPSRLDGRVHVAGFSGSGFSARASHCGRVSYADRAGRAVAGGTDLVVVQGGLNDHDQPEAEIAAGFRRLMTALAGHTVVVVGPAAAPRRREGALRVDGVLRGLSRAYDVPYVATSDLALSYLGDDLHLTAAGHAEFGEAVAERIDEVAQPAS